MPPWPTARLPQSGLSSRLSLTVPVPRITSGLQSLLSKQWRRRQWVRWGEGTPSGNNHRTHGIISLLPWASKPPERSDGNANRLRYTTQFDSTGLGAFKLFFLLFNGFFFSPSNFYFETLQTYRKLRDEGNKHLHILSLQAFLILVVLPVKMFEHVPQYVIT